MRARATLRVVVASTDAPVSVGGHQHAGTANLCALPASGNLLPGTRRGRADGLIPLTCNEIRRLFTTLVVRPVHDVAHRLAWSAWRRRHQARAQASHYRRQAASQT